MIRGRCLLFLIPTASRILLAGQGRLSIPFCLLLQGQTPWEPIAQPPTSANPRRTRAGISGCPPSAKFKILSFVLWAKILWNESSPSAQPRVVGRVHGCKRPHHGVAQNVELDMHAKNQLSILITHGCRCTLANHPP